MVKEGFEDIEVNLHNGGYDPSKTSVSHPYISNLKEATRELVGDKVPIQVTPFALGSGPAYLFTPYTPICILISQISGTNGHAPNENFPKDRLWATTAFRSYVTQYLSK